MSEAAAPVQAGAAPEPAPASPALDLRFMQLALALGRRGLGRTWPNPAVGAVVVKDGVIIGRGWTQAGGRPQVCLRLAVSADGKAGLPGRKPAAVTGAAARARVHQMRAESDAILVGIGTVLSDDPHLTCRLPGMMEWSPVRVILDAKLR